MEEENDISKKFMKRKRPVVPAGFFEQFYAGLKDEIDALDPFESMGITKRKRPVRPSAGKPLNFETGRVSPVPVKKGRVIRLSIISAVSAVAATVAILLYLNREEEQALSTIPAIAVVNQAESEGELETYVAYLDEEEMIDYILENDISIGGDEDDEVYDMIESEIEDIYLDL